MGWKAACVFISPTGGPYLQDVPHHDPARAAALMQRLGYRGYTADRLTTFDEAIYPQDDQLFVGAYPTGSLLCSWPLAEELIDNRRPEVIAPILREAGTGYVLALVLHSVVDLFGYAYYEAGKLLRARSGSADDGIFVDFGDRLPEETELLSEAEDYEGGQAFRIDPGPPPEYVPVDQYGEEFTFEVSRKAFGSRMDYAVPDGLELQLFIRKQSLLRSLWSRMTGAA
jgi:hypothetical protein